MTRKVISQKTSEWLVDSDDVVVMALKIEVEMKLLINLILTFFVSLDQLKGTKYRLGLRNESDDRLRLRVWYF